MKSPDRVLGCQNFLRWPTDVYLVTCISTVNYGSRFLEVWLSVGKLKSLSSHRPRFSRWMSFNYIKGDI